jgi:hypothetical protein
VFTVDRELSFLSNGTNFQDKEYGDRSCCDQQSGRVFRSEQKLTELAFRHCCLLSHALLRYLDCRFNHSKILANFAHPLAHEQNPNQVESSLHNKNVCFLLAYLTPSSILLLWHLK